MKKIGVYSAATVLLACFGLTSCTQSAPVAAAPPANTDAKDVADIKTLEEHFIAALKAKDVNAIMSLYVPDQSLFVFDVTPPRQYAGAAAYRKDWEDTLGLFPGTLEAELTDLDVTPGGGSIAYGHSIQHLSGKMKDGKPMTLVVRLTDGYKKVGDKWLIAQEHVSVPVDLITGKADLLSKP